MLRVNMTSSWEAATIRDVKKLYWLYSDNDIVTGLDLRIRDTGIHIWPTDLSSVPFNLNSAPREVEWHNIQSYSRTAQILSDIGRAQRAMASPADFLRALHRKGHVDGKINLGTSPHVCLYETDGPGQARTGYGALIAIGGGQPSLVPIECGDGWGENCVFATVRL